MSRKDACFSVLLLAVWFCPAAMAARHPDPLCLNQTEFIEYGRKIVSPTIFAIVYDPAANTSLTRGFKDIFEKNRQLESAARGGDSQAQTDLALLWAKCRLDGVEYAQEKHSLTLEYLRAAQMLNNDDARYLLALYRVLGWDGQRGSLVSAYPLLVETGLIRDDDDQMRTAHQRSRAVLWTVLQELLNHRLAFAPDLVRSTRPPPIAPYPQGISTTVVYHPCRKDVRLESSSDAVNEEAVLTVLRDTVALLPDDGLNCDEQPMRFPLRFAVARR
jgi:hypothetical protein